MSKQFPIVAAIRNGLVSKNSTAVIINILVEFFYTNKKGTLVGSNHDLSIVTGYSDSNIDLPNGDAIDYLNDTFII